MITAETPRAPRKTFEIAFLDGLAGFSQLPQRFGFWVAQRF